MISTQDHYETICDSLGVPPEYGPMAKPRYETWMLQTEATSDQVLHSHKGLFV